jgi:hypothetical protein
MPWEVTIRRADGEPLGDVPAVRERIEATVAGMRFFQEPSGAERVAAARARGVEFPDVIRQVLEKQPAKIQAVLEGDGVSVLLYGFEAEPLSALHAEVRGAGDPHPVSTAPCRGNGWVAADDATGQPVSA